MSSSAPNRHGLYWFACVVLLGAGCATSHPCGPETCDYRDNDCDGLTDEGFLNADGLYDTENNCGACGVVCADVFLHAADTTCSTSAGGAACGILSCDYGYHVAGAACVADVSVLCRPCAESSDCGGRGDPARCVSGLCYPRCDDGAACPDGTECVTLEDGAVCQPAHGDCTCNDGNRGLSVGCFITTGQDHQCAGQRVCGEDGFSECAAALTEECNGQDDDCDGSTDEDFKNEDGIYATAAHCGACDAPCVAPGPHMTASCDVAGGDVACHITCEDSYVDVDGIGATGCECRRWTGSGPPPVSSDDADCDGVIDDSAEFVHVTTTGNDANPGTVQRPMRTIQAALARGKAEHKHVLVARGVYDGSVALVADVSLYGGYRADFRDHDVALYPVVLTRSGGVPGAPVITCTGITTTTQVDGLTITASAAARTGDGSTALFSDGCGDAVSLTNLTLLAARGAAGARGDDSSDRLTDMGFPSLNSLRGTNGTAGQSASGSHTCAPLSAGTGGAKLCPGNQNVSGGAGGRATCAVTSCVVGSYCANAGCDSLEDVAQCDVDAVVANAVPNPSAEDGRGPNKGAAGPPTYDAPTGLGICNLCLAEYPLRRMGQDGTNGGVGVDGLGGLGCVITAPVITADGRLHGDAGQNGTDGQNGSGGGGGSAGSGYMVIPGTEPGCVSRSGAAGGGGGSGGCGAPGAGAGGGGGASVGIVLRTVGGAGPTLAHVRVVTASGGRGGDGGVGASGGAGGVGGSGGTIAFWCANSGGGGGNGGPGGDAGGAGGGCGGGSHGVVVVGGSLEYAASVTAGVTVDRVGVAGAGGRAGASPGAPGTAGAAGSASAILTLP